MPHQRGDHPSAFNGRGRGGLRDSREPPTHSMHPSDFQRRRLGGPVLVHHASPGGHQQGVPPGIYSATHPHSPAWYGGGSVASTSPHRVPGSSLSVASGETLHEVPLVTKEATHTPATPETASEEEMRKKQAIIHEALRRHMDDDNSIGTNEADAASALLFATTAMKREVSSKVSVAGSKAEGQGTYDNDEKEHATTEEEETQVQEETTESSGPLKKRRKLLDILRQKPVATATTEKHPLHVSPLPSPQVRSRIAGHDSSEETLESATPPRPAGPSSTGMTNSYGAEMNTAAEISPAPPVEVVDEHFPTVLHTILTSSEFAGSVVAWLPDGEAWKIIRWDALRRQVLPKYFSKMRDEDGKIGSSIDAFLWQLTAWGFEEIQDGPDVGAYKNKFFCKESIRLCRKMTFSPKQSDLDSKVSSTISEKVREASQPHSILQVPSLASRSEGDPGSKEAELRWREEQRRARMIHSPTISYPSMAGRPIRHPDTPVFGNYRMGDLAYAADGWQYFPESPIGMRHMGPGLSGYEQRMLQQQRFEFPRSAAPARHGTSPRAQSGRGALRLPVPHKAGVGAAEQPMRRSSFPVSNRGKGNRVAPGLRVPVAASEITRARDEPKSSSEQEETEGLEKVGKAVAERVAVAISKKTKRKLPLSGSSSSAAGESQQVGESQQADEEKPSNQSEKDKLPSQAEEDDQLDQSVEDTQMIQAEEGKPSSQVEADKPSNQAVEDKASIRAQEDEISIQAQEEKLSNQAELDEPSKTEEV